MYNNHQHTDTPIGVYYDFYCDGTIDDSSYFSFTFIHKEDDALIRFMFATVPPSNHLLCASLDDRLPPLRWSVRIAVGLDLSSTSI